MASSIGSSSGQPQTYLSSIRAAATAVSDKRVEALMDKSIARTNPDALYSAHANGGIQSVKERKDAARAAYNKKEQVLEQWGGMKKVKVDREMRNELELLRYRNFLDKDTKHLAPKGATKRIPKFFEVGYFADVGQKKRKECRSFADEWMAEDPELKHRMEALMEREQRRKKKERSKRLATAVDNKKNLDRSGSKKVKVAKMNKKAVKARKSGKRQ
jgi:hypothetical protein